MSMARPLKFRAWFHDSQCFWYSKGIQDIEFWKHIHMSPVNQFVIEQFTGLHDSTKWEDLTEQERDGWTGNGNLPSEWKGRKIYEGDIVSSWFPDAPDDWEVTQEIMFVNGYFGCGGYPLGIMDLKFFKVIGTVHENPELLK